MLVEFLYRKKLEERKIKMKEVLILTQAPAAQGVPHDDKLQELKKELEKKTGKDVVVLYPGMTVESVRIRDESD